jgi:hypothetical protein
MAWSHGQRRANVAWSDVGRLTAERRGFLATSIWDGTAQARPGELTTESGHNKVGPRLAVAAPARQSGCQGGLVRVTGPSLARGGPRAEVPVNAPPAVSSAPSPDALRAAFLALLPRIRRHGEVVFRHVQCQNHKEDAIGEMVALAWKWLLRLAERGKDVSAFPSALCTYLGRAVRSGRRLCGQEKARDVLSARAQQRRNFAVGTLADVSTMSGNPLDEALHDNTRTPVPEQVCFRCDFPCWLASLGPRHRALAEDMALGHATQDLARRYGVSASRVSQLRRAFHADWTRFCDLEQGAAS